MRSRGLKQSDIHPGRIPIFWSRVAVAAPDECWLWKGTVRNAAKYGQIGVNAGYYGAHVVSYVLSHGDVPPGQCVLHTCDNPPCVNPKHLWLGTKGDNNSDRRNKGREGNRVGERNGRAVLNATKVQEIRQLGKTENYARIAERFGVCTVTVAKICQRKLWAHVP